MGRKLRARRSKHVSDTRYSYSFISAAWVNATVGDMISDIMADGVVPRTGTYKSRPNPRGFNSAPRFEDLVRDSGGFDRYALRAAERSKADLQREYIRWYIAKERSYGFVDPQQEGELLAPYLRLLAD